MAKKKTEPVVETAPEAAPAFQRNTGDVWVPELMRPGLAVYAFHSQYGGLTREIHEARQFATREECQAWIDGQPAWPPFTAMQHGFAP